MASGVSFFVSAVPVSARWTVLSVSARCATPAVPTASVVTVNTPTPATIRLGRVERERVGRLLLVYTVAKTLPVRSLAEVAPCAGSAAERGFRRPEVDDVAGRDHDVPAAMAHDERALGCEVDRLAFQLAIGDGDPHRLTERRQAGAVALVKVVGRFTPQGHQRRQRDEQRGQQLAAVDRMAGQLLERHRTRSYVGWRLVPADVEADADDDAVEGAWIGPAHRLGEDAGQLPTAVEEVVGPLELGRHRGQLGDGLPSREGDGPDSAVEDGLRRWPQQDRAEQRAPGRGGPRPPEAAPPGRRG